MAETETDEKNGEIGGRNRRSRPPNWIEEFQRATAASLRALAGRADMHPLFDLFAPPCPGQIKLPPLHDDSTAVDITRMRGMADLAALWLRHHDAAIDHRFRPAEEWRAAIWDGIEEARVEALGATLMPGIRANIEALLDERWRAIGWEGASPASAAGMESSMRAEPASAIRMIAREELARLPPPPSAQAAVAVWRAWTAEAFAPAWEDLRRLLPVQAAFAARLADIFATIRSPEAVLADKDPTWAESRFQSRPAPRGPSNLGLRTDTSETRRRSDSGTASAGPTDSLMSGPIHNGALAKPPMAPAGRRSSGADRRDAGHDQWETLPQNAGRMLGRDGPLYRAWTTRHDEVVRAEDLVGATRLAVLRRELDRRFAHLGAAPLRLAHRLGRALAARSQAIWEFGCDDGMIDGATLAAAIVDPLRGLTYKRENPGPWRDVAITLLIDHSSSMIGDVAVAAAGTADLLTRTLEGPRVAVEVLGFTTAGWDGGRALADWEAAGRPHQPGRLNDLRHIVTKSFATPWRQARRNFGLMLEDEILRENIDGEALLWASGRLLAMPATRHILAVVSDGAPADESTLMANGDDLLEQHLFDVVAMLERDPAIELVAIGIGHDVGEFYPRAITVADVASLSTRLIHEIAAFVLAG